MNPDLVGAAGLDFHIEQREPVECFVDSIKRKSGSAAWHHSHPGPVARVAVQGRIDRPALGCYLTVYQGEVRFENFPLAELVGEVLVRFVCLCNNHQAGCVTI
jgi:hypothetical protein